MVAIMEKVNVKLGGAIEKLCKVGRLSLSCVTELNKGFIMKKLYLLPIAWVFSAFSLADSNQAQTEAALAWLAVVDSGKYEESWHQTAPFFQSKVSSEQWKKAVDNVRTPLGKSVSREIISATAHTSLPNAPKGEYVVVKIAARFENKETATETITVTKTQSGDWRVVGYFIK
ncbi:DUF4019 domain-containing protein [Porticoccus sp. W117]|uniref:DUF4019 domain-containing protein n=1 Tax=Porticoccus sp. W117 TaxID=3054777 RepID=UPI002599D647|nr:DUF4019 domain-containing protein [Porticoccus sp. W117]MDM3872191.1 DUF4019 domain-containing protein [Porticoccus sp. W117]